MVNPNAEGRGARVQRLRHLAVQLDLWPLAEEWGHTRRWKAVAMLGTAPARRCAHIHSTEALAHRCAVKLVHREAEERDRKSRLFA